MYITREGVRKFFSDYGLTLVDLQRGDIVSYSDEL